jgi:hypothetical protein
MENKNSHIFLIVCVLWILSSCSDDSPDISNPVRIDGREINIVSAVVEEFGCDFDGCRVDVTLSDGISRSVGNDQLTFDGATYILNCQLIEPASNTAIRGGRYRIVLNPQNDDYYIQSGQLFLASVVTEFNEGFVELEVGGGNDYLVTYDIRLLDGTVIQGSYTGVFQVFNR